MKWKYSRRRRSSFWSSFRRTRDGKREKHTHIHILSYLLNSVFIRFQSIKRREQILFFFFLIILKNTMIVGVFFLLLRRQIIV